MAQLLIRDLAPEVVARLKKKAREDRRSLQAEVKFILERAAFAHAIDLKTARKISQEFQRQFKGREFPDTISLIREDRAR